MPAVRGDGMRGLAVFISDIRNCKSKEAEIKRINKELANIRSKFKVWYFLMKLSETKQRNFYSLEYFDIQLGLNVTQALRYLYTLSL